MGRMSLGAKIKLGISAALIILVILASNPEAVGKALTNVDPILIGIVVLLYLINMVFKAYRWGVLMRNTGHSVSFRTTFTVFSLSQVINNLIPGRVIGETSRIMEVNSKEGMEVGKGLATVVTERVMDFVVLTLLSVTSLILLLAYIIEDLRGFLIFMVLAMVLANMFFIYILAKHTLMVRIGGWGTKIIKKVVKGEKGENYALKLTGLVGSFNEALSFKGNRKLLIWASVLTMIIWANEIFRLYLIMEAIGADVSIVAVIATASLASLSAVLLSAGSGNVVMSSAVFTASGLSYEVAATAGLLSALTSIWLSVPVCLLTMLVDHRKGSAAAKGSSNNKSKKVKRGFH